MKHTAAMALLTVPLLWADTPSPAPARQLYDAAVQQVASGQLQAARRNFEDLVHAYPADPLALQAKGAIDATMLFEEGEARAKSGKYQTARLAFATLVAVYPESPLAERSKAALATLAEKEKMSGRVVEAMEFREVGSISAEDLRAALESREVRLAVGRPYRARDLEQAKTAIEEILAEKGIAKARVLAQARSVASHGVDVIFTVERSHASLLATPWRLAAAGWHRVL